MILDTIIFGKRCFYEEQCFINTEGL